MRDESELPPIHVTITEDERELAIKVSDEGGGIPRQDMPRIWSYLHTTAKRPANELIDLTRGEILLTQSMAHGGHGGGHAPMAGLGFGLPLSRVFARYWGGDLDVISVPSYGTDAHLHLNKLGDSNLFVD
jgi:pyruvate dehydrogenase kinase 2/3/4